MGSSLGCRHLGHCHQICVLGNAKDEAGSRREKQGGCPHVRCLSLGMVAVPGAPAMAGLRLHLGCNSPVSAPGDRRALQLRQRRAGGQDPLSHPVPHPSPAPFLWAQGGHMQNKPGWARRSAACADSSPELLGGKRSWEAAAPTSVAGSPCSQSPRPSLLSIPTYSPIPLGLLLLQVLDDIQQHPDGLLAGLQHPFQGLQLGLQVPTLPGPLGTFSLRCPGVFVPRWWSHWPLGHHHQLQKVLYVAQCL